MTLPRNESPGAIMAPGDSGITQSVINGNASVGAALSDYGIIQSTASTTITQSAASTALTQSVINGHMSIGSILPTWAAGTYDTYDTYDATTLELQTTTVNERLRRIEQMLGIVQRDLKLEAEFPDLVVIGNKMDDVFEATAAAALAQIAREAGAEYISFADECNIMKKLKLNNDPND